MKAHSTIQSVRTRLVFIFLLLVLPTLATATDLVGIYFDEDYQNHSIQISQPNTIVTGYLVLQDPSSAAGVAGWELCVGIQGPGMLISWELAGQTINVETPPCFVVGVGDAPLPGGAQVLLGTFTMLVQEPEPITLSIEPVYFASIPGEMAYVTNDDPGEILAMYPTSGYADVAWINQEAPAADIYPLVLNYQEVAVGDFVDLTVTVANPGGGPLLLDLNITGDETFHLTDVYGVQVIYPGEELEIPVRFTPSVIRLYEGTLTFGNTLAPPVPLVGVGRASIVAWDVLPELAFNDIPVGSSITQGLTVTNIGEDPFPVIPHIPAECTFFTLLNPGTYVLEPGAQVVLEVAFAPLEESTFSCELDLGPVVDSVALTGTGYIPNTDYSIDPEFLVFGDQPLGYPENQTIVLSNIGEQALALSIAVADPSPHFSIQDGLENINLLPGNSLYIHVNFDPTEVGAFSNEIVFGNDLLANVPISGNGVAVDMSCTVSPPQLDFGTMTAGLPYTRYFSVRNTGNVQVTLDAEAPCYSTSVSPASRVLNPGQSVTFTATHYAYSVGDWQCTITMGNQNNCPDVECSGVVVPPYVPNANLVGLFFDEDFYMTDITVQEPGIVEAYLVLLDVTDVGISGWECRFEIEGEEHCQLMGADLMGDALNVGSLPEFVVGLGTPLPALPEVHLATLQLMVLDEDEEIYLHLQPVFQPSIEDEMAWVSADYSMVNVMHSFTGSSQVASINAGGYVAIAAPAPEIIQQGSLVELTWNVQENSSNSYLVYRRGESEAAEALFDQPMTASGNEFVYRDNPTGYTEGTTLHYSYAVLQNGVEVTRSPETDVVLSGLPVAMTRLLPNVPNPFNPMTEIYFEMEKSGMARVSVYDVSGRLVVNLVNEQLSSGPHARVWQGRDATGRQVPSGSYYVRMDAGGQIDHRKIMLLK